MDERNGDITTVDVCGIISGGAAHLSIGPTFECPASLVQELPALAASQDIQVKIVGPKSNALGVYCVFTATFGRIDGHLNARGAVPRLWLTFPRAYAFNPLLWPLNFRLIRRIERFLLNNNARRCDWKTYFEGF